MIFVAMLIAVIVYKAYSLKFESQGVKDSLLMIIGMQFFLLFLAFVPSFLFFSSPEGLNERVTVFYSIASAIGFFLYQSALPKRAKELREENRRNQQWEAEREDREREQKRRELEKERKKEEEKRLETRKRQTEEKAMNKAISYETETGRYPADVSKDNLGYDIKSSNDYETRFIEVKGLYDSYSYSSFVLLTENEWRHAQELENSYYLYVVCNCSSNYPELLIVKNPANNLSYKKDYESSKYKIDVSNVKEHNVI